MLESLEDRSGRHNQMGRHLDLNRLLLDDSVQPRRIDGVLNELLGLQELDEVLDSRTDFSTDFDLLQSEDQEPCGPARGWLPWRTSDQTDCRQTRGYHRWHQH